MTHVMVVNERGKERKESINVLIMACWPYDVFKSLLDARAGVMSIIFGTWALEVLLYKKQKV